jgi:hypothetical protein
MAKSTNGITKEQLMTCYHLAAKAVSLYGDSYLPVFKRLHEEVEKTKQNEDMKSLALILISGNNSQNKSEQN